MALVAGTESEIGCLLDFVLQSGCTFIRNGTEHSSKETNEHLACKYDKVRPRIGGADSFVDNIATRSSLTRRRYEVCCGRSTRPSAQWLREALAGYRRTTLQLSGGE